MCRKIVRLAVGFCLLFTLALPAAAQKTWTGAAADGGNWNGSGNWKDVYSHKVGASLGCGVVPPPTMRTDARRSPQRVVRALLIPTGLAGAWTVLGLPVILLRWKKIYASHWPRCEILANEPSRLSTTWERIRVFVRWQQGQWSVPSVEYHIWDPFSRCGTMARAFRQGTSFQPLAIRVN